MGLLYSTGMTEQELAASDKKTHENRKKVVFHVFLTVWGTVVMPFTPTVKLKTDIDSKQGTEVVRSSQKTTQNDSSLLPFGENQGPIKISITTPSGDLFDINGELISKNLRTGLEIRAGDLPGSTSFGKSGSSFFTDALPLSNIRDRFPSREFTRPSSDLGIFGGFTKNGKSIYPGRTPPESKILRASSGFRPNYKIIDTKLYGGAFAGAGGGKKGGGGGASFDPMSQSPRFNVVSDETCVNPHASANYNKKERKKKKKSAKETVARMQSM